MTCFSCRGHLEDKLTSFMVEVDNCTIIVKGVPSQVCKQCGEVSYTHDVALQLESIVNAVREPLIEMKIINYSDKVVA